MQNEEEILARVAPLNAGAAPTGSTAEQGQGVQSSPAPDVDVQLLAWAVSNCHTLARRRLNALRQRVPLDALLEKEFVSWDHVLRICAKAGARSAGVLRASVPTEITGG
jgi:hypothetical protein